MTGLEPLHSLAGAMGVSTTFMDGLHREVEVGSESLVRVCAALGAEIGQPSDAADALQAYEASRARRMVPSVLVAWDGVLEPIPVAGLGAARAQLRLEDGSVVPTRLVGLELRIEGPLPLGYHCLTVESGTTTESCTVIAAPVHAYHRSTPPPTALDVTRGDAEVRAALAALDALARADATRRLASTLEGSVDDLDDLLDRLLDWLGRSTSPLVIPWLEDLWLEIDQVNLPGTRSSERPNWQRPMARTLDEALSDTRVVARARRLDQARKASTLDSRSR